MISVGEPRFPAEVLLARHDVGEANIANNDKKASSTISSLGDLQKNGAVRRSSQQLARCGQGLKAGGIHLRQTLWRLLSSSHGVCALHD